MQRLLSSVLAHRHHSTRDPWAPTHAEAPPHPVRGSSRSSGSRRVTLFTAVAAATAALLLTALPAQEARAQLQVQAQAQAHTADLRWHPARCRPHVGAEPFTRTELFFGLSRPGGVVTEGEFKSFIDAHVTPRFPDGLTLLTGVGQFRDSSQTIIVEGAKLLILLYPRSDAQASQKIEQIRSDYKVQFQQQSVLRTDEPSCVSF